MLNFLLVLIMASIAMCMTFAEDVESALRNLFRRIYDWVRGDTGGKPINPTDTFLAVLLSIGLYCVARGNYDLIVDAISYILPLSDPSHAALGILTLAMMNGILLHSISEKGQYVAMALSVIIVVLMSGIAYSKMEQYLIVNEMEGNQPTIAAIQFGVFTILEIFCAYGLVSLGGKAIGYLWLLLLSPVWLLYIIAWLSLNAKKSPMKLREWLSVNRMVKTQIFLKEASGRRKEAEETQINEPEKTEKEITERTNETIRRISKGHLSTVRGVNATTSFWLRLYGFFVGMIRGASGANSLYNSLLSLIHSTFNRTLSKIHDKIGGNGSVRFRSNGDEEMEPDHSPILRSIVFLMLFSFTSSAIAEERLLLGMLDVTESYPYQEQSITHFSDHVLSSLGPNDKAIVFSLGNKVELANFSLHFPKYAGETIQNSWRNVFEWQKDKKQFSRMWEEADEIKAKGVRFLKETVKEQDGGGTYVHQMLSYASTIFRNSNGSKKVMVIYSDLLTEDGKQKTRMPPDIKYPFDGVEVYFLYTVFSNFEEYQELEMGWSSFFKECSAKSFTMLDPASSSLAVDIIPKNSISRDFPRFGSGE
jgi:hypothetical protein